MLNSHGVGNVRGTLWLVTACALVAWAAACGGTVTPGKPGDDAAAGKDGSVADARVRDDGAIIPSDAATDGNVPAKVYKDYVFVASGDRIYRYEIVAATGALAALGDTNVGAGGVQALASSQDGAFLYTNVGSNDGAKAFSIAPTTGNLTDLGGITVDGNAVALLVDATGKWLLSTYFSDHVVLANGIGNTGALVSPAAASVQTPNEPHQVVLSADNRFLFIPSRATHRVYQYTFNQTTGAIAANGTAYAASEDNGGARHLAFHPNGALAFCINEFGNSVTVFSYNATTGVLTRESTVDALPNGTNEGGVTGADIHITPNGKFLYASERGHNSIAIFTVNAAAKTITRVANQATEAVPRDFGMDAEGRFLYVAGQNSGKVAAYAINQVDGTLNYINHYDAGSSPQWVEAVRVEQP